MLTFRTRKKTFIPTTPLPFMELMDPCMRDSETTAHLSRTHLTRPWIRWEYRTRTTYSITTLVIAVSRGSPPISLKLMQHVDGNCVRWISPDGKRQEAAERYLTHRGHRKTGGKIQIFTGRTVSRVIIDNGIAKGLEVIDTGKSDDSPARILARKQVLLCAGTFGSPTILERSGVGDAKLLHSLGIEVIEDLPGVGREFEDHQVCSAANKVGKALIQP